MPKILCIGLFDKVEVGGVGTTEKDSKLGAILFRPSGAPFSKYPFIVANPEAVSAEVKRRVYHGPFRGGNGLISMHALFLVNPQDQFCTYIDLAEIQAKAESAAASLEEDIGQAHEFLKKLAGE